MAFGFVVTAAFQSARLFPSRKNRSFSRDRNNSFPVPLRIRRKEVRSTPRGVFSFFLFGRRHLPLYRCSSPRYLQATETQKSTRTSVDAPLIVTISVLRGLLLSVPAAVLLLKCLECGRRARHILAHGDDAITSKSHPETSARILV
jgi:hypothetical protein